MFGIDYSTNSNYQEILKLDRMLTDASITVVTARTKISLKSWVFLLLMRRSTILFLDI